MTTLREAAQQALEALEEYQSKGAPFMACDGAIDALRAALAQQDEPVWMHPWPPVRAQQDEPVQKPVAWLYEEGADSTLHWNKPPLYGTPLYTAPPRCPNCASLEAQNDELDRKLAELEQAHGIIESEIKEDSHQTLDDAMRLPRAMAQAYENGYKAGVAAEREECAQVCESRFMGDLTREDMEARRCAAAIRARGGQP